MEPLEEAVPMEDAAVEGAAVNTVVITAGRGALADPCNANSARKLGTVAHRAKPRPAELTHPAVTH